MLLFHELHKLLSGKTKWLVLAILLVNSFVFYLYMMPYTKPVAERQLHSQVLARGREYDTLQQALDNLEADVTACAHWGSMEMYQYSDQVAYELKSQYQDAIDFAEFIGGFQERAQNMLDFPIFAREGSFAKRNIIKTAADFQALEGLEVYPADGEGLLQMQKFFISDVFLLVLVFFLSFQLFGLDASTGINKIINATPRGGRRLLLVQVGLVGLCAVLCAFLLYGSNLLQTSLLAGLPALSQDIHGIAAFQNIPEENQRSKRSLLTDAGKAFVEEHILRMHRMEERAWLRLTSEERESLIGLTQKISRLMQDELEYSTTNPV